MDVIGVNEDWLAFFARVITPQVYIPTTDVMGVRGRVLRTLRRGLPLRQAISKLFNEVVLFVVDVHVRESTQKSIDRRFALNDHVQLIRVVDDMILFHKDIDMVINGWKALQSIMPALGLRLNKEKCGSCIVNKHLEEPDGLQTELPQKDIIYGMLRLQRDGQWIIDEEAWKQTHERLGQRIKDAHSVLSKVNVYNGYIRVRAVAGPREVSSGPRLQALRLSAAKSAGAGAVGGRILPQGDYGAILEGYAAGDGF
ncbi:hypothetical protein BC938DRAFT_478543 [Jimgerdemannia flammicorona]|uniref:Reverse transcriptase domain-containing protein n=1 Tax=Jimgerdemannia flammicorona TaxID=994334 RepID=A0A433P578_9FUNG|nr:hypothetical protein BC938DRAFT_478543 [Jimgerdemannia flammicorona]